MKNKKFATAMLAAVLACTVAVSGCGKPDNGGDDGGNTGVESWNYTDLLNIMKKHEGAVPFVGLNRTWTLQEFMWSI